MSRRENKNGNGNRNVNENSMVPWCWVWVWHLPALTLDPNWVSIVTRERQKTDLKDEAAI